jgi:hypothetical protein
MTRLSLGSTLLALVTLILVVTGCSDNPVGRICFIGNDAGTQQQNIVASPALECQSRTCLHVAQKGPDLCTGECSSDGDCDKAPESPCNNGFACIVPVTVGPFCCKKMCVCRDYLIIPDGGIAEPAACDSNNADNECCNLSGRRDNPTYPGCL